MAREVAIRVNEVYKDFVLPHERAGSVKNLITGLIKNKHSQEFSETQHALENISFEVTKGEFFGIVGRNGSGKSTLLKILAGIYQPTQGRVTTVGKLVPFIELGVGFNPELTGRENVFLNGAMLGFSESEIHDMYDDIVEFAELERFMDKKLKNYSSGMQVRLAFSMATRSQADILLVDEVLAVGDADFQRKCFEYFKQLKKDKKTVVFVSHDMDAVREYCDRAILIEASKVLQMGETRKVAEHYSKLFNTGSDTTSAEGKEEKEQDRWGTGAAKIASTTIDVKTDDIFISQTVTAKEEAGYPVVGFRIRNAAGVDVTGTNNKVEKNKSPLLKAGQSITYEWRIPNILSDGKYFLDQAVLGEDGITVMDWWNSSATFTVQKTRRLPYAVDPGFNLSISSSTNKA